MKWIGITGGIATGKSTVSKIIQDLGGVVVDADQLAREVVAPGTFGLGSLVQIFGPVILARGENTGSKSGGLSGTASSGGAEPALDRAALGKIIFAEADKREIVERLLHPLIQRRALEEREKLSNQGLPRAFYDASLIFEKGMKDRFDSVILISTSFEVQKSRLMKRDGLSAADAEARIASQMPLSEKIKLADHVIENDGDTAGIRRQVEELLRKL